MVSTILGRKLGMTQVWDENDNVVPVTVIQAGPCTVSQVKSEATDGYNAVQIGFGDIKAKHVNKPMAGHFAKAGVEPVRYLREVRVASAEEHKVGDVVSISVSLRRLRKFTKPLVIWSPARTVQPSSIPGMKRTDAGTRRSSRIRL